MYPLSLSSRSFNIPSLSPVTRHGVRRPRECQALSCVYPNR